MAVNTRIENNPDGGFSVVFEEDGSGDLNRIIDDLCKKHREEKVPELMQPMDGAQEAALDAELDEADID